MKKITRRSVLLECLQEREMEMKGYSRDARGLISLMGYEELFEESREKCRILRELVQALESEPVRKMIANWQMEIMNGQQPTLEDLKPEQPQEAVNDHRGGQSMTAQMEMDI